MTSVTTIGYSISRCYSRMLSSGYLIDSDDDMLIDCWILVYYHNCYDNSNNDCSTVCHNQNITVCCGNDCINHRFN